MALRNSTFNGITDAGIASLIYDMLLDDFGAASDTAVTNATVSGTEIQMTKTAGGSTIAWISPRVATGFTLTSTDVGVWLAESAMTTNIVGRYRVFRRTSGGTVTELGGGPFTDDLEMTQTTPTEMLWVGNVTDTVINVDDRLVLKLFLANIGTMAAGTGTLTFNTTTPPGDSYFNLVETVSFKAEPSRVYVSAFEFEVPAAGGPPPTTGLTAVGLVGARAGLMGSRGLIG